MGTLLTVDIDEGLKLRGYLAIDSTVNGRSHGGLRMAPDLSPQILFRAARAMTLKYGFLGLPVGGAKAGIIADPEMPPAEKRQLMKRFGQALRPLLRTKTYVPAGDLGITDDDIRFILDANGIRALPRSRMLGLSGSYTGLTVFMAAARAAQHTGLDLNHASVAIEGFGSVGGSAAQEFWKRGIKVVAVSTTKGAVYWEKGLDIGKLIKLREQVGSEVVKLFPEAQQMDKRRVAELEVDIVSPCAQSYSLTAENAHRVTAKIICPGANAPTTPEAERILLQRGILCVPDFMANCGGVLGSTMKLAGLRQDFIRHFVEHEIGQKVTDTIKAAEKAGIPIAEYAEKVAEERFVRAKEEAEKRSITGKVFNFAVELYRNGVIPYQLVTPVAPRYFKSRLGTTQ